jgi:inhibitor of cysteine peptidase
MKNLSIALVALVLVFSSCEKDEQNKSDNIKPDYEISINESFQLDLISNPTTGYSWKWTNREIVSIVDTIDHSYAPDTPILLGSGGKEIWKFKGIKTGIDTIKLEYKRSWESNSHLDSRKIVVKVQ